MSRQTASWTLSSMLSRLFIVLINHPSCSFYAKLKSFKVYNSQLVCIALHLSQSWIIGASVQRDCQELLEAIEGSRKLWCAFWRRGNRDPNGRELKNVLDLTDIWYVSWSYLRKQETVYSISLFGQRISITFFWNWVRSREHDHLVWVCLNSTSKFSFSPLPTVWGHSSSRIHAGGIYILAS